MGYSMYRAAAHSMLPRAKCPNPGGNFEAFPNSGCVNPSRFELILIVVRWLRNLLQNWLETCFVMSQVRRQALRQAKSLSTMGTLLLRIARLKP